jgi:hypothetical protein
MEAAIAALVLLLCLGSWWAFDRRRRLPIAAVVLASLVIALAAWTAARFARLPGHEEGVVDRPIEASSEGYVSSRTCEACHPEQYETWHASYHRTMTQVVRPGTTRADLDGVELHWQERDYRLERRGDEYWVKTSAPGTPPSEQQIVMSTGSHSMQVFWMTAQNERKLEMLPFHYLVPDDRWVHRSAAFLVPPGSAQFGSEWNTGCIHCHTTRGQPRVNRETVDTQVAEFGIACEACHGPGERHVRENRSPLRRYQMHLSDAADPGIVNPERLDTERASEVCGRCHGYGRPGVADKKEFRWTGFTYKPGDDLSYSRRITLLDEIPERARAGTSTMFWSDGMVRGSGREFGALLESPCFKGGDMSCLSCHTMHKPADDPRTLQDWANDQLKLGMDANEACASCHPALVADTASHTRHAPESSGSLCYNCHMPYTTYGLLKGIRSHEIDSPSVATSLTTGRPNACNQCHLDQTLEWSADHLQAWFDEPKPELDADQRSVAASLLWLLSGDAAQRALMAWSFGWEPARGASGTDWMAPYLAQLLEDPYPAVRFVAERSLRGIEGFEAVDYDFMGTDANMSAAHAEVLELWSRHTPPEPRGPTMIRSDGRVHPELFVRLLSARNDRPVIVAE